MKRILWADDEIDMLRAHILFLREKGYEVITVTNGDDAIFQVRNQPYDMVLLDEMMPGKDGLTTVNEIKNLNPHLPVIMITKNEEETLMEDAIGKRIDDYLTKPVNPSQILMACKKILDRSNIITEKQSRQYAAEISNLSLALMNTPGHREWMDLAMKIFRMDMDINPGGEFRQVLADQRKEMNVQFGKYIEKNYPRWLKTDRPDERPRLSTDIISDYLVPVLKRGEDVVFVVIDCLRLDQWLTLEPLFNEWFRVNRSMYYSILPTATPFSRNAIFSGLFPLDIEKRHPEMWSLNESDESLNKYEKELLDFQLKRKGLDLGNNLRYVKIMNNDDARQLEKNLSNYSESRFLAIVVNTVDILAHSRSDLPILKEIAPDEAAYRSITKSWFEHSAMPEIFRQLSRMKKKVVITTDHGSVRGLHGTKVMGDRETSTNLRYKYGRSLRVEPKHAVMISHPEEWRLPNRGINTTYLLAKEDYYFVYPTNYNKFLNYYRDSFQHGGISIEEMILPVVELNSR